MAIQVFRKPEVKPKGPSQLLELVPYKVHSVNDKEIGVSVGDIVLRFPSRGSGQFILNCNTQSMLWDRSTSDGFNKPFLCIRAHEIQSSTFTVDNDDAPSE